MLRPNRFAVTNGTSLQGYVYTSYDRLVKNFGEPNVDGDGYKTDAEWALSDGDEVVTIYNYKDGPNYLREAGCPVEDILTWHIGGRSSRAVDLVHEALPSAEIKEGW